MTKTLYLWCVSGICLKVACTVQAEAELAAQEIWQAKKLYEQEKQSPVHLQDFLYGYLVRYMSCDQNKETILRHPVGRRSIVPLNRGRTTSQQAALHQVTECITQLLSSPQSKSVVNVCLLVQTCAPIP